MGFEREPATVGGGGGAEGVPGQPSPPGPAPERTGRDLLWIMLFAGLLLFPNLGQNRRWASHEGRHAEIALEMATTGDYLVPHSLGRMYPDKPPVLHTMMAGLFRLTGVVNMTTARLPSAVAALLSCLLVYALGRTLSGRAEGWLAAFLLITTSGYLNMGRIARPDMVFATLILAASLLLVTGLTRPRSRLRSLAFAGAAVAATVATVAKGPYGLLFPVLFLFLASFHRTDLVRPRWHEWLLFGLVWAAGVGAWATVVYQADGGVYLRAVVSQSDLTKGAPGHLRAFLFYFVVAPVTLLPMVLFAPCVVVRWRRLGYSAPTAMFVLGLLILSCVPGKREYYLLPLLPFSALALAEGIICCTATHPWVGAWARRLIGATGAAIVLYFNVALPWNPTDHQTSQEQVALAVRQVPPDALLVNVTGLGETVAFVRRDYRQVVETPTTAAALDLLRRARQPVYLYTSEPYTQELVAALPGRLQVLTTFPECRKLHWSLGRYTPEQ